MNHQACWHKACRVRFSQTKLDRLQKKITKNQVENEDTSSSVRMVTRSSLRSPSVDLEESTSRCFFCDEPAGPAGLHNASTYDFDRSVRKCALQLEDTALLAKLSSGDMIATEAKYHSRCLVALRNRARSISSVCVDDQFAHLHGIAFAELVTYIEDFRNEDDVAPVFKLVDLAAMYKNRLEQLGMVSDSRVHTSRLKLGLLSAFPDLKAHVNGRNVMLSFHSDVGMAITKACSQDSEREAMCLARAARIVRREMFNSKFSFNGSFTDESQNIVPQSLLALVNMILEGPNIKHQTELVNAANVEASYSISQLMMFNSVQHARGNNASSHVRHIKERETPFPLYLAMKIHAATRSRH